jgi:hypothetical protein
VRQQLADGHRLPGGRAIVEVGAGPVIDAEQAARLQDQDRHGRELLGDRSEPEPGVRRVRRPVRIVGEPEALAHHDLAIPGHQDGAADVAGRDQGVDQVDQVG